MGFLGGLQLRLESHFLAMNGHCLHNCAPLSSQYALKMAYFGTKNGFKMCFAKMHHGPARS